MSNKIKGTAFLLISALGFSLMNLFIPLAGDLPSVQKAFFRNLVAFIVAFILLLQQRPFFMNNVIPQNRNKSILMLILRATFGTLGIYANYYALDHLLISDASVLNKISPFAALIFSAIFLGEKFNKLNVYMIILAFIGVLFVTQPSLSNPNLFAYFIGLLGGVSAGAAYTCVRQLNFYRVQPAFIVFFFSGFSCLIGLPQMLFQYHSMTWSNFIFLIGAGLSAALGQFGITLAYKYAAAKDISIFDYATIVFTSIWGMLFLNQIPDHLSVIGYGIIFTASVISFFYNKKH